MNTLETFDVSQDSRIEVETKEETTVPEIEEGQESDLEVKKDPSLAISGILENLENINPKPINDTFKKKRKVGKKPKNKSDKKSEILKANNCAFILPTQLLKNPKHSTIVFNLMLNEKKEVKEKEQKTEVKKLEKFIGCEFCEVKDHITAYCTNKMEKSERKKIVEEKKLCWVCGKVGHKADKCYVREIIRKYQFICKKEDCSQTPHMLSMCGTHGVQQVEKLEMGETVVGKMGDDLKIKKEPQTNGEH